MRVVKHDFLREGKESQLHQGPVEGGQLGSTGVPYHAHEVVSRHHHGPGDDHLVEDDRLERVAELRWIHLEDEEGVRETRTSFTSRSHQRVSTECWTAFSLRKEMQVVLK